MRGHIPDACLQASFFWEEACFYSEHQEKKMTQHRSVRDNCSPSTASVHAGETRDKPLHSLVDPVFQTSSYTFQNMAEVVAFQTAHNKGHVEGSYEYGRYGNPTIAAAEAVWPPSNTLKQPCW